LFKSKIIALNEQFFKQYNYLIIKRHLIVNKDIYLCTIIILCGKKYIDYFDEYISKAIAKENSNNFYTPIKLQKLDSPLKFLNCIIQSLNIQGNDKSLY